MTLQEVENRLGPERFEGAGWIIALEPIVSRENKSRTELRQWISKRAAITIGFDRCSGCVTDVWFCHPIVCNRSVWEKFEERVLSTGLLGQEKGIKGSPYLVSGEGSR
jgi:hypothetical protein